MDDMQRAYLARSLADTTYGPRAVDNRLVNFKQLSDRVQQVHRGAPLNSTQLELLLKNNPEQLSGHVTDLKNLSDLMPPSGFHNYDYLIGEADARLAPLYVGKSDDWIKQHPPWKLMQQIGIDDPSRLYNKDWFKLDKIRDLGL
jgi:hypothetical protein